MPCFAALRYRSKPSLTMKATQFIATVACCVCLGCGSGSPYSYVKATGKITYDDGTPLRNLRVLFAAQDAPTVEGAHPRPAVANLNDQGEFDCVTSYKYGDGLIAGKHKVAIESGGSPENSAAVVPKEYQSIATTPLIVDTANLPIEIKVPKPKGKR
jgi:hypothetical protein